MKTRFRSLLLLMMSLLWLQALLPSAAQTKTAYSMAAYLRCTREEAILNAFRLMADGPGEGALAWIVDKSVRVVFKDMKTLDKGLRFYDALSWISSHGEQVIFINEKHRNAPPEALAAMLAHEAMHNDAYNSIREEIAGWHQEAVVWSTLKTSYPSLAKIPQGAFPLVDRENRIEQEFRRGTLEAFVKNNNGYRGLPETSPGFTVSASGVAMQTGINTP